LRGQAKLIAVIILVAIAVVLGTVAANYMMTGVSKMQGYATILRFYDGYANYTTMMLTMHMQSFIKPLLVIYKIEVGPLDVNVSLCSVSKVGSVGRAWVSNGKIYVLPGTEFILTCPLPRAFYGDFVNVKIYTESGLTFRFAVPSGG